MNIRELSMLDLLGYHKLAYRVWLSYRSAYSEQCLEDANNEIWRRICE